MPDKSDDHLGVWCGLLPHFGIGKKEPRRLPILDPGHLVQDSNSIYIESCISCISCISYHILRSDSHCGFTSESGLSAWSMHTLKSMQILKLTREIRVRNAPAFRWFGALGSSRPRHACRFWISYRDCLFWWPFLGLFCETAWKLMT